MNRTLKGLTVVAAVGAMALCNANSAFAGWGSYGSSGGTAGWASSGGSYGSSGGSSGGSWGSYGSHGGWGSHGSHGGPIRHALHHIFHPFHHHHHHYSFYSCGSSGGTVTSWGHGSWGSSGGSSGGSTGGTYYRTPMSTPMDAPMDPMGTPMGTPDGGLPAPGAEARSMHGSALLAVKVPAEAKVFVNGRATNSTGESRQYVSRGLTAGFGYTYEVRAEAMVDGQLVEDTKTVRLEAGDTTELEFDLQPRPETVLTVNVPADAKVTLAGTPTSATGDVRVFRTTALPRGQEWSDYLVKVTVERDGKQVTKEEKISLKSGDQRALDFEFDVEKVASTR